MPQTNRDTTHPPSITTNQPQHEARFLGSFFSMERRRSLQGFPKDSQAHSHWRLIYGF